MIAIKATFQVSTHPITFKAMGLKCGNVGGPTMDLGQTLIPYQNLGLWPNLTPQNWFIW